MAWNDGLDPTSATFAIAADDARFIRVIAGPGTGKSFALKRRVARLLQEGVPAAEDRAFERLLIDWLRFHRAMLIGEIIPELYRYLRTIRQLPNLMPSIMSWWTNIKTSIKLSRAF